MSKLGDLRDFHPKYLENEQESVKIEQQALMEVDRWKLMDVCLA